MPHVLRRCVSLAAAALLAGAAAPCPAGAPGEVSIAVVPRANAHDAPAPREETGLFAGLRAWWSFDATGANGSRQGSRLDAAAVNGASVGAQPGIRGRAARFRRAQAHYLLVSHGVLDEASARHTLSLWCRPASLPAAGGGDRAFLLETTPGGAVTDGNLGYALSLGFRSASAPELINLQQYTRTLSPSANARGAPEDIAQGGFDTSLPRSSFSNRWAHIAQTFDGVRLRLFLDGEMMSEHILPKPGPLAPHGGLVIGGHRAGVGRNFEGDIDEVALWSRVLSDEEILRLSKGETPGQPEPAGITRP